MVKSFPNSKLTSQLSGSLIFSVPKKDVISLSAVFKKLQQKKNKNVIKRVRSIFNN